MASFFQNVIAFLIGPDNGSQVKIGGVNYYTANLKDVTSFINDNDVMGFEVVNPNDESQNISWRKIKAGEDLGQILGYVPGETIYIAFKDGLGNTYFVSADTLTNTALGDQNIPNVKEQVKAQDSPLGGLSEKLVDALKWTFIAIGILLFLAVIIVLIKTIKE